MLEVDLVRGAEVYRFAYAKKLASFSVRYYKIDPTLRLFSGDQYNNDPRNFRVFMDSCPDRWGQLLMKRREAALARQEGRRLKNLNESDYLLGVHDAYRMGGFTVLKTSKGGPFLDDNQRMAAPPISSLKELEYAVSQIEQTGRFR